MNNFFAKLPFKRLLEKVIPEETITKIPLLGTLVNYSNQIVVVLVAALLANAVLGGGSGSGGGGSGGRPSPATDFSFQLNSEGNGIIITGYNGSSRNVVIPSSIEGYPVVRIQGAFNGNSTVTSVVIPNSVTVIGRRAFYGTANLSSITIPNSVVRIEELAFNNTSLRSIVLPDSVVHIGMDAFRVTSIRIRNPSGTTSFVDRPNLTRINLPANIEEIGREAFSGNSELTDLIIPASINNVRIGGFAFMGCSKLPISTRQRLQALGYTGSF